jgi:hypothetical protein
MRSPHFRAFAIMLMCSACYSTRRLNDVLGHIAVKRR